MNPGRAWSMVGGRPVGLVLTLVVLTLSLSWPRWASAGAWSETGSLGIGRCYHTSTRLWDGRILVAGGVVGISYLNIVEIFDPATGTWSTTGPMHTPRCGHTATLLADGRILVAGGYNSTDGYLNTAEIFHPGTGTWEVTGSLAAKRRGHTATRLPDGRVLVTGGSNQTDGTLASVQLFSPGSGTWSTPPPMANAREQHTATLLTDGRVLVVGGYNSTDGFITNAQIFTPEASSGTWTTVPSPTFQGRRQHTATLLADGRVLVVGGYNFIGGYLDSVQIFNPAGESWTTVDSIPGARKDHTAVRFSDGRVLVAGGENLAYLESAASFNPATGFWSPAGPLSIGRALHTAEVLPGGQVLAMGGSGSSGTLKSAEIYDQLNLVMNRSFETSSLDPGGGALAVWADSTEILRWTVGDAGVMYREDWQAAEGRRSVELNSVGMGSIRTAIPTTPGASYQVTFAMAGYPGAGPAVKSLRVSAAGLSQDFSFDTFGKTFAVMGWATQSWTFRATAPSTTLKFASLTAGYYGPAVDKVRVIRAAPLPPLLPLLLD